MENELIGNWQRKKRSEVYNNPWITVSHDEVITPGGSNGIYGVVHFKNLAIGIVPVDADMNTYLVGQFRYPLNKYTWEIPEGGGPLHLEALESAQRELQEEVGLTAGKWTEIQRMDLSNSATDERAILFLAEELSLGESNPEDTEELEIKKLPLKEAYEMVLNGEITDSLSVVGLMRAAVMFNIQ